MTSGGKARIDAARALSHHATRQATEYLTEHETLSTPHRIDCILAGSHAFEACVEAVDLAQRVAGTTGVRRDSRFQQYFRDIHTMNQNAIGSEDRFETAGQLLLGRTPDMPLWRSRESEQPDNTAQ